MKRTEPNLKDWASKIAYIARNNFGTEVLEQVEAELKDIADKHYQMGFEDGDKNGWWEAQENPEKITVGQLVSYVKKEVLK